MTTRVPYQLLSPEAQTALTAFRNKIINGDMRIDQRNAGASVAWASNYALDRWTMSTSNDAVGTTQQIATGGPAGFPSFRRLTVTTADTSLAAGQYQWAAVQVIEGNNIADLAWGTAAAKPVTVQFRVRASKAGTFSVALGVGSPAQFIHQAVTINAANTWETKTLTFAGNTTTSPVSLTTGAGVTLYFVTAAGTNYHGTPGVWASSVHLASASNSNFLDTVGGTFDLTGVQLEAGPEATPFERKPYGAELALCQRYYERSNALWSFNGASSNAMVPFKVTKRAAPTVAVQTTSGAAVTVSGTGYVGTDTFRVTSGGASDFNWDASSEL